MDRKELFRNNLRRMSKNCGWDRTSLAAEMGLDNAGRKWLRRLWDSGIDRVNHKTEHQLGRLVFALGLREQISGFGLWDVYSDVVDDECSHMLLWRMLSEGQTKEHILERLQVQENGSWCCLSALESIPSAHCEMRFLDKSHAAVTPNDEGVFSFRKTHLGSPVEFVLVYKMQKKILGTVQLRQGEIQASELVPHP